MKLLTLGSQSFKLAKSDAANKGYLSAIVYLAPHKLSGKNLCPNASPGCIASCLNTAGRGQMNMVAQSRLNKSKFLLSQKEEYVAQLTKEISLFEKKCAKAGKKPAIRLNGTSDLDPEMYFPGLLQQFPNVQFYDYTKSFSRMKKWKSGVYPSNYHLTFSRSEINEKETLEVLKMGASVAVVWKNKLPKTWNGYKVYDADKTDLRFLDKVGVQGLTAKGKAKKDMSGFVING